MNGVLLLLVLSRQFNQLQIPHISLVVCVLVCSGRYNKRQPTLWILRFSICGFNQPHMIWVCRLLNQRMWSSAWGGPFSIRDILRKASADFGIHVGRGRGVLEPIPHRSQEMTVPQTWWFINYRYFFLTVGERSLGVQDQDASAVGFWGKPSSRLQTADFLAVTTHGRRSRELCESV